MSRRIEVELTSQQDDGNWTWRAAGAKQPKGVVDGALLYDGVSVGDVVRADADFEIDGIFVTNVMPPKGRSGRPVDERIELLDSGGQFEAVTTQLAKGRRGGEGDRDGRGGRGDKRGDKRGGERGDRGNRGGERGGARGDRSNRGDGRDGGRNRSDRGPHRETEEAAARPRPKKLRPGRAHRKALIDALPEEQRVVAETVSRGGIAAIRKEIETQNARAASEGGPEVKADALIALAESLVPKIKIAEWRDRADAALVGLDEVDIRDLRTVLVAAEDAARDDEGRAVAEQLRAGLNARVEKAQSEWHDELRTTLAEGRAVRALRLSSRPPKAGSPLPPDIAEQLAAQANEALIGEVTQQRLGIVLEAVAYSPVRPYIVLPSIPDTPTDELMEIIRKVADRIPDVATRFGIDPTEKRRGRGRGRGKGGGKDTPPRPPKPPVAGSPDGSAEAATADASPDTPVESGAAAETALPEPPADAAAEVPAEPAAVPATAQLQAVDAPTDALSQTTTELSQTTTEVSGDPGPAEGNGDASPDAPIA